MTRLQDGQDETKEKKFKPNGQTIKSPYFSGTLSAAILKTPPLGRLECCLPLQEN